MILAFHNCSQVLVCQAEGVCTVDNECACSEGRFGDLCQFSNSDYTVNNFNLLPHLCQNFPSAQFLTCGGISRGVCVTLGISYCLCNNTEFTGRYCQFNRTCQSTCQQFDNSARDCLPGDILLYSTCRDDGSPFTLPSLTKESTIDFPMTSTSTINPQNLTSSITTSSSPEIVTKVGNSADATLPTIPLNSVTTPTTTTPTTLRYTPTLRANGTDQPINSTLPLSEPDNLKAIAITLAFIFLIITTIIVLSLTIPLIWYFIRIYKIGKAKKRTSSNPTYGVEINSQNYDQLTTVKSNELPKIDTDTIQTQTQSSYQTLTHDGCPAPLTHDGCPAHLCENDKAIYIDVDRNNTCIYRDNKNYVENKEIEDKTSNPCNYSSTVQSDYAKLNIVNSRNGNEPLFPETFTVFDRSYSIKSDNISEIYYKLEDYQATNEESLMPYAIIIPDSSERNSNTENFYNIISSRKSSPSPPLSLKPKFIDSDKYTKPELLPTPSNYSYWEPARDFPSLFSQMKQRKYKEFNINSIKLFTVLGSGEFGQVWKGTFESPIGEIPVAIKMLKTNIIKEGEIAFLQEAAIMGQFDHPNVLRLLGVVTMTNPKLIITELMDMELRGYLLNLSKLEQIPFNKYSLKFLNFCKDIASGMKYLSNKGFIHRDLAARNILLNSLLQCKIADFGMSRRLMDGEYYTMNQLAKIPLKWCAPESIFFKKFTTKSDIWSFAMVMYEIWSIGEKPWSLDTIEQVITHIQSGTLNPPPSGCPRDIYLIMILCWHPDQPNRPSFEELHIMLENIIPHLLRPSGDGIERILGKGVLSGVNLYKDLQLSYKQS